MTRLRWTQLALLLVAGCTGPGDTLLVSEFGNRLVVAYCENQVECGVYGSMASCVALSVAVPQREQSVAAGRAVFDAEQAAACVAAIRIQTCDSTDKIWWQGEPECDGVISGAVTDGGQCFASNECVSERCTMPACDQACCVGTCAPTMARGAVGAPCGNGRCVDGAYCDSGAGRCVAFTPGGEPCSADFYCATGFGCAGGTCVDLPDRGEPCPLADCAGWGDRCDASTITCLPLAGLAEACTVARDCQRALFCGQGTCRALPTAGQPCAAGTCATGTFCDGGTCAAQRADGEACADAEQCSSGYCETFTAAPVCAARPVCG